MDVPTGDSSCVQVFEEVPNALDGTTAGTAEQLAGGLVPRILQLFTSPHTDIKARPPAGPPGRLLLAAASRRHGCHVNWIGRDAGRRSSAASFNLVGGRPALVCCCRICSTDQCSPFFHSHIGCGLQ